MDYRGNRKIAIAIFFVLLIVVMYPVLRMQVGKQMKQVSYTAESLRYKDRSLHDWIKELEKSPSPESIKAVVQTKTNSMPLLVRLLTARDSGWMRGIKRLIQNQSIFPIEMENASDLNRRALTVFQTLRAKARPAIPLLIPFLTDSDESVRIRVVVALFHIQSDPDLTVPALTGALEDPNPIVRKWSALSLGRFGRHATTSISALEKLEKDGDPSVSLVASTALRLIVPPGTIVPSL